MVTMWLTVSTVKALTFMTTLYSSPIALAIVFLAWRLLTSASAAWNIGWNSFEMTGISVVSYPLSMMNPWMIGWVVSTAHTYALVSTRPSTCETLTVKFQTIYFCAFASSVFFSLSLHSSRSMHWRRFFSLLRLSISEERG